MSWHPGNTQASQSGRFTVLPLALNVDVEGGGVSESWSFDNPSGGSTGLPSDLQFLAEPDPLAILDRLCAPGMAERLDLYRRIDGLVAEQGVLVSQHHLLEKWVAQMALVGFQGEEAFEAWLERRGREALEALLSEQHLEEVDGLPVARSQDFEFYQVLTNALGVELADTRRLCLAIHALPLQTRQAFRALTIDERTVTETCALMQLTEDELGRRLHQAFEAIQEFLDGGTRPGGPTQGGA